MFRVRASAKPRRDFRHFIPSKSDLRLILDTKYSRPSKRADDVHVARYQSGKSTALGARDFSRRKIGTDSAEAHPNGYTIDSVRCKVLLSTDRDTLRQPRLVPIIPLESQPTPGGRQKDCTKRFKRQEGEPKNNSPSHFLRKGDSGTTTQRERLVVVQPKGSIEISHWNTTTISQNLSGSSSRIMKLSEPPANDHKLFESSSQQQPSMLSRVWQGWFPRTYQESSLHEIENINRMLATAEISSRIHVSAAPAQQAPVPPPAALGHRRRHKYKFQIGPDNPQFFYETNDDDEDEDEDDDGQSVLSELTAPTVLASSLSLSPPRSTTTTKPTTTPRQSSPMMGLLLEELKGDEEYPEVMQTSSASSQVEDAWSDTSSQQARQPAMVDHVDSLHQFLQAVTELDPAVRATMDQARAYSHQQEDSPPTTTNSTSPQLPTGHAWSKAFQLQFLRAEYYVVDRAAHRYARYWDARHDVWGSDTNCAYAPSLTQARCFPPGTLDATVLHHHAYVRAVPNHERVFYLDPSCVHPETCPIESVLKAAWYVLETCLDQSVEHLQCEGAIFVLDISRLTPGSWRTNPQAVHYHQTLLSQFLTLLIQESLPIRCASFCILNGGAWNWVLPWWIPPELRSAVHTLDCRVESQAPAPAVVVDDSLETAAAAAYHHHDMVRDWTGGVVDLQQNPPFVQPTLQDHQAWLRTQRHQEEEAAAAFNTQTTTFKPPSKPTKRVTVTDGPPTILNLHELSPPRRRWSSRKQHSPPQSSTKRGGGVNKSKLARRTSY